MAFVVAMSPSRRYDVADVVFHGTNAERDELLLALNHWCECVVAPVTNIRTSCCPGHTSLNDSQSYIDHLEFARTLRDQLVQGEFTTHPTHRPGGKL